MVLRVTFLQQCFAVAGDYQPNDEMFICYASVFDLTDVEKDIYAAVENMQVSLNDVKQNR